MTLSDSRRQDGHYLSPPTLLRLKNGEDFALEQQAAELLAESRQGVTRLSEKRDFLTADQLRLRYQREVPNHIGICDESLVRGIFKRDFNPLSGTRPSRRGHSDD